MQSITSVVELVDTSPDNIDISYTAFCGDQEPVADSSRCDDVILGETLSFNVTITATDCVTNGDQHM